MALAHSSGLLVLVSNLVGYETFSSIVDHIAPLALFADGAD